MIDCRIVTPEGIYKEFKTPMLTIDTVDGQRGVLPNHMPLVTMLKIGEMFTEEDGVREEYAIAGGVFYFRDNQAEILTDAIENKKDIDIDRANQAKQRAEERISATNDPDLDLQRAEIALKKAMNRLKVSGQ